MKGNPSFNRLRLLTGDVVADRLRTTSVIVFGVGGVGSWCAEALARSGVGVITLVDSDLICRTNINRQVQATAASVGRVKVRELAARLSAINPGISVEMRQEIYKRGTADRFRLENFDYVIDAIDSLSAKVDLIISATEAGCTVFTALGASCKMNPTRIRIAPLWESQGCHLGKLVRKRLRRRKFTGTPLCVYSEELLPVRSTETGCGSGDCICPKITADDDALVHEWCSKKKQINGSAVHITGTFGFFLAGMVVQDVQQRVENGSRERELQE
ncbi:MAG: ThiF family adenylyltransferase [Chitinispirillaceae bacterium]|nr:ThiF family adenylyltransferase [Chitinispirillaceae bacterium]